MPTLSTQWMAKRMYEICTLYAVALLAIYVIKRDADIPLTYRTAFSDWPTLKNYLQNNATTVSWPALANIAWCPNISTSQQCSCFYAFYKTVCIPSAAAYRAGAGGSTAFQQLGQNLSSGIVDSCLRQRPTWRKDTCDGICKVHLVTPVLMLCLGASLFFSRVSIYDNHTLSLVAFYGPIALGILTIVLQLVLETLAGLLVSLSILGMFVEISYIPPCEEGAAVFWSYQRYLVAVLAVWAAVTHLARDLYLVPSYGLLGFILGVCCNYERLIAVCTTPRRRALGLYLWVAMCCIAGCFVLLVQQNWYSQTQVRSGVVSVVALITLCAQCLVSYTPRLDLLHMTVTLLVVTACFASASWDALLR